MSDDLSESSNIVVENVTNEITNTINSSELGGSVSISDIISSASSVSGVEAVSINKFCEEGESSRSSFIKALDNQTIVPGAIEVTVDLKKFFIG